MKITSDIEKKDQRFPWLFLSTTSSGTMLRRLVPVAIVFPVVLGWLSLQGEYLGLYKKEFGVVLFSTSMSVAFIAFIWKVVKFLEEEEINRINVETQLRLNIQQLKESEEKFEKAFYSSAGGFTITRLSDSTYLEVNNAFAQMTGYPREELIGRSSTELGIIIDVKKREEVLQEIREYGSAKNFEMTVQNKQGNIFTILSSVETILLNGEKYAINVIYDITDRKNAEDQLASVNKELEAFTYSVSHDLRAPLRAVNGYAEMLNEDYGDKLDAEGVRIIEIIKLNATKMGSLIDELLSFSRLGRKEIQKQQIDMNQLINEVLAEINKTTTLKANIKVRTLCKVKADYSLLSQALFNLISNALKYSSKKENPIIEIDSQENSNETIFSVRDNGAGFDMEFVDKLFGVFQRLHSQEEFEGTGVGLAIVQRIIAKHGGKVWAEGKINEGAVFYFLLPKN